MTEWRNRIISQGVESPDNLLANPKNWRIHPQHQKDALAGVLDSVGWVQTVLVNQRTGLLIDGHLRVALALQREEAEIPVSFVDLSDDEEALILATLDPLAALAATDKDALQALLDGLEADNDAVAKLLESIAQDAGLSVEPPPSLDDLAKEHGEPDDETFWPVIKIKVPPDTLDRFSSMMRGSKGTEEWQRLEWLLERVDLNA